MVSTIPSLRPILIAAICLLLFRPPIISSANELATQVCRNTTDFSFCQNAIYSDPRAPTADRVVLAYIAFGKAYSNATDTRDYISSEVNSGGGNRSEEVLSGLRKCLKAYNEAVSTLSGMLGDLDSESYYELDKRSVKVEKVPAACEKGFRAGGSPVSGRNNNLVKLGNICYVVSKLFTYN